MATTMNNVNSATRFSPRLAVRPVTQRRSPRLLAQQIEQITAANTTANAAAAAAAKTAESGSSAAEPQTYKSIIRTRSQKLNEQRQFVTDMFTSINAYYVAHNKEPSLDGVTSKEVQMAQFLQSLREAHNMGAFSGTEGAALIKSHFPWLELVQLSPPVAKPKWSGTAKCLAVFAASLLSTVSMFALTYTVFLLLLVR